MPLQLSWSLPLPLVTSQARLESDVLDPQPGVTAGTRRMFQALGGPDRYPAVPSVSRYSVRQGVRAPLVEQLGYASTARLSPTVCTLAVGDRFLSWIRLLRFDCSRVPGVPSTFNAVLLACLRYLRNLWLR